LVLGRAGPGRAGPAVVVGRIRKTKFPPIDFLDFFRTSSDKELTAPGFFTNRKRNRFEIKCLFHLSRSF
jgi:hypothetical protein